MFNLEIPLVTCPTCEGMGKWKDDDEDSSGRWISCDDCQGEGGIPADQVPDYEAPSFEEALGAVFAAVRMKITTQVAWATLSGHLSLGVRATDARRWSRLVEHHQRRVLTLGVAHTTTLWALWTISQCGPNSHALGDEYLILDLSWPGLTS